MFETERLILREVLESDSKALKNGLNQVDYLRFATCAPLVPISDEVVKVLTKPKAKHELPKYALCKKPWDYDSKKWVHGDDAKPLPMIGVLVYQNEGFDYKNRGCNIGIGFHDPGDRGKGYGTEVLKWALDYGFYELGLVRIGLVCYSNNVRGLALYRKIGFVEEGRIRKTYFCAGKWYDSLHFGMLETEWSAIKAEKGDEVVEDTVMSQATTQVL